MITGGPTLATDALRLDLVDVVELLCYLVLLGRGVPVLSSAGVRRDGRGYVSPWGRCAAVVLLAAVPPSLRPTPRSGAPMSPVAGVPSASA